MRINVCHSSKKRTMKNLVCIALLFFLVACTGPNVDPECIRDGNISKAYSLLVGKWFWVQTYTHLRGQAEPSIQTPETVGVRKTYLFRKNGTFEFSTNDILSKKGVWKLKQFGTDTLICMEFTDDAGQISTSAPMEICGFEFTFQESYDDTGGSVLYIRAGK